MEPMIEKRRPISEINVVPYIDVMLVLLIIFMVTAPMLVQTVPVDLPEVDSRPTNIDPDDSTIIITVDKQGLYYIERDKQSEQAMMLADVLSYSQKIKEAVPTTKLMIRGDSQVPYGKVVTLMGGLQQVGIHNVGLITEAPDPGAKR
ncbi:MAG: protein TolR [Venatoribacter sp.]